MVEVEDLPRVVVDLRPERVEAAIVVESPQEGGGRARAGFRAVRKQRDPIYMLATR